MTVGEIYYGEISGSLIAAAMTTANVSAANLVIIPASNNQQVLILRDG